MAENKIDVYNKINECEGLESLFINSLPKCENKSDVVIVYAHHLLTEELDYECATIQIECDENGEKKEVYKTMDSLPANWNHSYKPYNLTYKTEKETRTLTAKKNCRDICVYFSTKGCDQNKISSKIILSNYVPDSFLKSNDLSLIDNLSELRDILLKCFSKNDKFKAKKDHDAGLIEHTYYGDRSNSSNPARKTIPSILNDNNDPCNPLRNIRHTASSSAYLCLNPTISDSLGKLTLQDNEKHRPVDHNRSNMEFLNDPNYVMAEDPVGPPDESYIK